jgi:hypothetical protein
MFATRRAVDDQHTRRLPGVVVAALRLQDSVACGEPVNGDLVIGIGKSRTRFARMRRLARMAVGVPGGSNNGFDLAIERLEGRIGKPRTVAPGKLLAGQFDRWPPFTDLRIRHAGEHFRCGIRKDALRRSRFQMTARVRPAQASNRPRKNTNAFPSGRALHVGTLASAA